MTVLVLAAVVVACGALPALALAGPTPVAAFLTPLAAAAVAGMAATGELLVAGGLWPWLVGAALVVDGAAVAWMLRRPSAWRHGRSARSGWSAWDWVQLVVVGAAVAWPLAVLATPVIGYDTQAIWLPHAAMVYAGHGTLLGDLANPLYAGSNPDYPPLAPAAMAAGYLVRGGVDQHLAVIVVAVLNASAIGLAATGLLRLLPPRLTAPRRVACLLVVAAMCGAVFGVGGEFAVNGYADVLWAAAASAAVIYGLVLPAGSGNRAVAAAGLTVAALTKNEGLVTALGIAVLMAWRAGRPVGGVRPAVRYLFVAGVPFLPAAVWLVAVRAHHITDAFFATPSHQTAAYRLGATLPALGGRLDLVPVAGVVAVAGRWLLGSDRRSIGAGPSLLLWAVAGWSLAALIVTYTFGSLEIHWWLTTSVNRTTIFVDVVALVDMVGWLLVGMARTGRLSRGRHFAGRRSLLAPVTSRRGPIAKAATTTPATSDTHNPSVHASGW